jgi:DNA-binding MarR family transcriptional regulator
MLEILNQKYMNFLFEISKKPRNISELAKIGDLTLSVASTLISRWQREGMLIKEKSDGGRGKEIIIYMTDYGKSQIDLLKKIDTNYKKNKDNDQTKKEEKNGEQQNI